MRVLVVAAHPDDEALGCGGTIARHVAGGGQVQCLFMTNGVDARGTDSAASARRSESAGRAARCLGFTNPTILNFPDNGMDSVPLLAATKAVERVLGEHLPNVIYTHHGSDLNVDHRITHQAVITACRPLPGTSVNLILCFETLSSTEWSSRAIGDGFRPNHFVNIAAHLGAKLSALAEYEEEMRTFPHPRSPEAVRALATLRGSCVGLPAAEAFELVRHIDQ